MVVGDEQSVVGIGYGKANEVPIAIQKGVEAAKKNLYRVPKHGSTITHPDRPASSAPAACSLKPASPGTGVIAGGGVRAVLELAGYPRHPDASRLGTQNPINLVKATMAGLQDLRTPEEVAEIRGLSIAEVLGPEQRAARRRRRDARGRRPTARSRPRPRRALRPSRPGRRRLRRPRRPRRPPRRATE